MQLCVMRQCFHPPGDMLSTFQRNNLWRVPMHEIVFIVVLFALFAILGRRSGKPLPGSTQDEAQGRTRALEAMRGFYQRRPF
jgi:hypothetical protein